MQRHGRDCMAPLCDKLQKPSRVGSEAEGGPVRRLRLAMKYCCSSCLLMCLSVAGWMMSMLICPKSAGTVPVYCQSNASQARLPTYQALMQAVSVREAYGSTYRGLSVWGHSSPLYRCHFRNATPLWSRQTGTETVRLPQNASVLG